MISSASSTRTLTSKMTGEAARTMTRPSPPFGRSVSSGLLLAFLVFSALAVTLTGQQHRYGSEPRRYGDEYERNAHEHRSSRQTNDYQQRQVPTRKPFEWREEGRTPRYEWSSSYYRTSTTTTTTSRPRWGSPDRDRDNSYQQQTISRGVSRSDGRPGSAPGPFSWYNETHHYDRTRPAYDPDLQGTTAAPDSEKTWDEEEWDGRDFFKPHFNEPHPLAGSAIPGRCDEYQACYPATGNLLIGREDRLQASSTCGRTDKVRYCVVSHLKEKKKCFLCDSRPRHKGTNKYHGIENVVSTIGEKRRQYWWQAENGVENVTIQFDLEAEFHFTHLVITFKTFRPAAMLIERSHDFGRTWQVYQYFAADCASSYPGVPTGARLKITDVVCDNSYSGVEPSTEGEVIFRVLPPTIRIEDPYKKDVQDILKITNLRIRFEKLHNLGDNLLDPRNEIKEKYYYSIYDIVVRGSCSCYGHASRCKADGDAVITDMVYGRCECTHHTKGLNCELCEELYNDLEWKPAFGRQTNACQRCNCNNHASRCHFDKAVYAASGNVSGGVCEDCQHNTMGKNCDRCKPFFFRDSARSLEDPYVCQECDCDPRGSEEQGLCDEVTDLEANMEAGKCHCKENVEGRRCDHCKRGFWNLNELSPKGCIECSCSLLGTVDNLGCNVNTGECICKRNVVGRDCNSCAPHYYGLSADEEGCKYCDCDPGGAYSNDCDQQTGQCSCRPHVTGRRCDRPEEGYFVPGLDHRTLEAEEAKVVGGSPQPLPRQPYGDRQLSWSGTGFMRLHPLSAIEFTLDGVPESKLYDLVVRYEPQVSGRWENVVLNIRRQGFGGGACSNYTGPDQEAQRLELSSSSREAAATSVCLEKGLRYILTLEVKDFERPITDGGEAPSVLIDSIAVIPRPDDIPFFTGTPENDRRRIEFERFRCYTTYYSLNRAPEPDEYCRRMLMSVGFYVFDGAKPCDCDATGSTSAVQCATLGGQCACKVHVAERTCNRCHIGYYGFGPDGCKPCDCHGYGSLDNFCDKSTGQCSCRTGTFGRACDECQPGYWNYPNCQRCSCNGFSELCDSKTGACVDCREATAGVSCEECAAGYYGDPLGRRTGLTVPCRQCPCPDVAGSWISHAATCELDPGTQNVLCHCAPGYSGEKCDRCSENYYGKPNTVNGTCEECRCNANIDVAVPGSCDPADGRCLKCLYHTAGDGCEICEPGFYGNALEHSCAACVCNQLGTDERSAFCNQTTGQCACLPNVRGLGCDSCEEDHWNLASKKGCEACDCDAQGSYSLKCNELDGQCHCKPTHGGRRCNECLPNHWGDPRVQCQQCDCNLSGSLSTQCDKATGYCVCVPGISGPRCDRCARGFTGTAPHCEACGECFENWDLIIGKLKNETLGLLDKARIIKMTGTTGAYTRQFTQIEENLKEVEKILQGQDINEVDLEQVQHMISEARENLLELQDILATHEKHIEDTKTGVIKTNIKLDELTAAAKRLKIEAEELKEEATKLQEGNVEGAYNITKDSKRRSQAAWQRVLDSGNILKESETKRRNTESLIDQARSKHNATYLENEGALGAVQVEISKMELGLPRINELVCDGQSTMDKCDTLCGGAGCGRCGGVSCTEGARTKAENALGMAVKAEGKLAERDREAKDELRRITDARVKAEEALAEAKAAFERIMAAKNASTETALEVKDLLEKIDYFLAGSAATPAEIRTLAEACKGMEISLDPKQIEELALEINRTIAGLKDIDRILEETKDAVLRANDLKIRADLAKQKSDGILAEAESVRKALEEARQAQEKAKQSIEEANGDIGTIDKDLNEIYNGAETAKGNARSATEGIQGLNDRLDNLKKKYASNKFKIDNAENESRSAKELAEQASRGADELEKKYQSAFGKLDQKSQVSESLKKRAQDLKDNASKLFTNVSSKLKKIEEFEYSIENNERKLNDLQKVVADLNSQMKNHLDHIEDKAKNYRDCQA